MAFLDRFRRNKTEDITKAVPPLPAGTNVLSNEQLLALVNNQGIGTYNPLARNPMYSSVPFAPSMPLIPSAINPVNADGRTAPRRYEYPVAWNIFVTEQRLVPWKILRSSAEQIDILRRCIEVLKSKATAMHWDIALAESATEGIIAEAGNDYLRAMQDARQQLSPEISRIRQFWSMPDKVNGLTFNDWLMMALEELLVIDALAIYPRRTVGGDLHSLEILDGTTIKPLLDDRGMRPMPPYPAYQQVLYGFPRGEFTATVDQSMYDGEYRSDELIYLVRNRRTWTPYGFSPTERSLPLADIYLRRQQWLRSEFTDGVSPDLLFTTDPQYGGTPELLRAWETIFNDDMSGQTERRRGAKLLPSGINPVDMSGRSEKFSAQLDEYLIKGICGHWGIMPSEIGFTPNTGLGGAGFQEGEAETSSVVGIGPLLQWLGAMLTDISVNYLGMPKELEFTFDGGRSNESVNDATRRNIEVSGGVRTINEARAELGLALIDAPMADMPMVAMGMPSFIGPEGLVSSRTFDSPFIDISESGEVDDLPEEEEEEIDEDVSRETVDEDEAKMLAKSEVAAFIKWASKGKRSRPFTFKHLDTISADALNQVAKTGDMEQIRSVASVVAPL